MFSYLPAHPVEQDCWRRASELRRAVRAALPGAAAATHRAAGGKTPPGGARRPPGSCPATALDSVPRTPVFPCRESAILFSDLVRPCIGNRCRSLICQHFDQPTRMTNDEQNARQLRINSARGRSRNGIHPIRIAEFPPATQRHVEIDQRDFAFQVVLDLELLGRIQIQFGVYHFEVACQSAVVPGIR
jgi:hypothetical protein